MKQITSISDYPKQQFTVTLENGNTVEFYLFYLPTQYSWYFDFTYNDRSSKGNKVVLTPNAIRQYRHIMPFGVAFFANSVVEPYSIDDFSTGRVTMAILNQEEVETVEQEIYSNE